MRREKLHEKNKIRVISIVLMMSLLWGMSISSLAADESIGSDSIVVGYNEEEKISRNAPYKLVDRQWIGSGDTKILVKTTYTGRARLWY